MNLEEIENNNRAAKSRRKIAGFSDKRWMEEIDWLIAEKSSGCGKRTPK